MFGFDYETRFYSLSVRPHFHHGMIWLLLMSDKESFINIFIIHANSPTFLFDMFTTVTILVRTTKNFKLLWTILVKECNRHANDRIFILILYVFITPFISITCFLFSFATSNYVTCILNIKLSCNISKTIPNFN